MQISLVRFAGRVMLVAAALAALAFVGAMKPAQAQSSSGSVQSEATENYIGSIRGAFFLFQNSHVHSLVGDAGSGGITITVEHKALVDRTSLDVDYIGASRGGNSVRLIPVLAEYTAYQTLKNNIHPYTSYGAGLVFSQITDTTNAALTGGKAGTEMAFSFALGADFKNNIYAEVRYLYTGALDGEDTSGPEFQVGLRL